MQVVFTLSFSDWATLNTHADISYILLVTSSFIVLSPLPFFFFFFLKTSPEAAAAAEKGGIKTEILHGCLKRGR